jgi:hypothetical protein
MFRYLDYYIGFVNPKNDEEKRLKEIYTQKKESMVLTTAQIYCLIYAWSLDIDELFAIGPEFTIVLARLENREDEIVTNTNMHDEFFKEAAVRDYILSRDELKEELASIMEVVTRDSMNDWY